MIETGIVSIHDVRPSTLNEVLGLYEWLRARGVSRITLLVVPGASWDDPSLHALRDLVDRGCEVAGHGWTHRAPPFKTFGHRLHGATLSRDQAEHLSRSVTEVTEIVTRCHAWFSLVGLPEPDLYVPPAWALGPLTPDHLTGLPFQWYEVLSGFVSGVDGVRRLFPLVGFEADNRSRHVALTASNRLNTLAGNLMKRPVRIAIHPYDRRLRLAASLDRTLSSVRCCTTAEEALRIVPKAPTGSRDTRPV